MKRFLPWVVATIFAVIFSIAGCGDGGVPVAPVEGTVKLDGKPLDKIQVEFWPLGQGIRSFGITDTEGRFKLMTDDGKREGASIGSHKVVLKDLAIFKENFKVGRASEDLDLSSGAKNRIPGKYADAQNSTMTKEVKSGEKNDFELDVTP